MGVAKQRKAIVDGLRDAVHEFGESVKGTSAREVMNIVRAQFTQTAACSHLASCTRLIIASPFHEVDCSSLSPAF